MLRGSDFIGIPLTFRVDNGKEVSERVKDWIFDIQANQLLGFLISRGGWTGGARVLMWQNVHSVTPGSIEIEYCSPVIDISRVMRIKRVLESRTRLIGTEVISRQGENLGEIIDVYFDEDSGRLCALATSGGMFADEHFYPTFVPVFRPLKIINGVAVATREMVEGTQDNGVEPAPFNPGDDLAGQIKATVGHRVRYNVRDDRALLVAAADQIVTNQIIDEARRANREEDLLRAVGLVS